jgi:hypothetical protein
MCHIYFEVMADLPRLVVFCPFYFDHYLICVYSPSVYRGVCVTRSLVLCVFLVDRRLTFCSFSFGHCIVCSSSIYEV